MFNLFVNRPIGSKSMSSLEFGIQRK